MRKPRGCYTLLSLIQWNHIQTNSKPIKIMAHCKIFHCDMYSVVQAAWIVRFRKATWFWFSSQKLRRNFEDQKFMIHSKINVYCRSCAFVSHSIELLKRLLVKHSSLLLELKCFNIFGWMLMLYKTVFVHFNTNVGLTEI